MSQPFTVAACPHCSGETRVPESLYRSPVKCPHCSQFFRLPNSSSPPEKLTLQPDRPSTLLPGLLVLLVGLIGLVCDGTIVVLSVTAKERMIDEVVRQAKEPDAVLKRWLALPDDFDPERHRDEIEERLELFRKVHFGFAVVSLLIALGGVGILRQRWYRLSLLSCFLAALNLGFFCCLLGLPVGLYGLVRLLDPRVKLLFDARK